MKEIFKHTWLFLICAIIYWRLSYIQKGCIGDGFNIYSSSASNFYNLLISTTAAIFGILVAVVLLVFQLLKKISLRRKDENIVYNPLVTSFICLSVFIIIFSTIAYLKTPDFHSDSALTQAYFLLILFILYIVLIFPLAIFILKESDNLKKTLQEIRLLNVQYFFDMTRMSYSPGNFLEKEVTKPLFKIRHEVVNAVRDYDNVDLTTILETLNERAIEIIGDGQIRKDVDTVLEGLTNVWKYSHPEALRTTNYQYYSLLWNCILKMYQNSAQKKIPLLHYQQLTFYIWEYIKFLSRNKIADCLIIGIDIISDGFKDNLTKNCPKQERISHLYDLYEKKKIPYSLNDNMQWDEVIGILNHLQQIHASSLMIPDKDLYISSSRELLRILNEIIDERIPGIEIYQEAFIIRGIVSCLLLNAYQAQEQGLFKDTLETYRFEGYNIAQIIIKERFYTRFILRELSDFLIKSQRTGNLNEWHTINLWGSIPRHTAKYYIKNATVKKATLFIFETLNVMKKEIETSQWPDQIKNYKEIKKQMQTMYRTLKEDGVPEAELNFMDEKIKSFKEINGSADFSIIKWPD